VTELCEVGSFHRTLGISRLAEQLLASLFRVCLKARLDVLLCSYFESDY
jgi:hypothetical protein